MSKERWEHVKYLLQDEVAMLIISRPDKLNALNAKVYAEIGEAVEFVRETQAEGLIITGAGDRAFVAGADIGQMKEMSKKEAEEFAVLCNRVFRSLELLEIPVIAAVNGYALGGGCELALACHNRICCEDAVFGLPEVTLGVMPGSGGTQRIGRLLPTSMAKELLFSGRSVHAREAMQIGLVQKIVPRNLLRDVAWQIITQFNEKRERLGRRDEYIIRNRSDFRLVFDGDTDI